MCGLRRAGFKPAAFPTRLHPKILASVVGNEPTRLPAAPSGGRCWRRLFEEAGKTFRPTASNVRKGFVDTHLSPTRSRFRVLAFRYWPSGVFGASELMRLRAATISPAIEDTSCDPALDP